MKDLPQLAVAATAGRVGGDRVVEFGVEPPQQVGLKQVFHNHPTVPLSRGQAGFPAGARSQGRECDFAHSFPFMIALPLSPSAYRSSPILASSRLMSCLFSDSGNCASVGPQERLGRDPDQGGL